MKEIILNKWECWVSETGARWSDGNSTPFLCSCVFSWIPSNNVSQSEPAGFWIRFYPWEALLQDLESRRATEAIIAPVGRFMGFNRWGYMKSCQELPSILYTNHLEAAGNCRPTGSRGLWACPVSLPEHQ